MRIIDADAILVTIKSNKLMAREPAAKRCVEIIKNATTYVDPKPPARTGGWVYGEYDIPHCSECGYEPGNITPFCGNCGADMRDAMSEEEIENETN